jgi:uncharacterized protein
MQTIKQVHLAVRDQQAIQTLQKAVQELFPSARLILFGSKARGEDHVFSDLDILILVSGTVDSRVEKELIDSAFEIGLEYDVVFNIIVETAGVWESSLARVMPLYQRISREGAAI